MPPKEQPPDGPTPCPRYDALTKFRRPKKLSAREINGTKSAILLPYHVTTVFWSNNEMDLFSLYVLFSHLRPRDAPKGTAHRWLSWLSTGLSRGKS